MSDAVFVFRDALQERFGLLNWLPIPDGEIHRFHVPGDRPGTVNGWYILFLDGIPTAVYGSWKDGITQKWCSRLPSSPAEARLVAARIRQVVRQREAAKVEEQRLAAERANQMWSESRPAIAQHPYLVKKRVASHQLRQDGVTLLVPLYADGFLVNLQQIFPDGFKCFLRGGRIKGCYFLLGRPEPGEALYVCEGFSTGATIHSETGIAVACAMNAGNMLSVGRYLQGLYPTSPLVIAGDDDRKSESKGEENTGVECATKAAKELGCAMVLPDFPPEAPLELSDFNDLAKWRERQ